ncbi:MAG: response regulator [Patescibacteria group bacterium]
MTAKKAIKALIVEDDLLLSKALSSKLEQEKFEVLMAKNGQEALAMAKEHSPDIILLDLMLPVMNGFEVLSNLKLDAQLKSIPVLILSNLGQAEEIKRGEGLGADGYLIKSDVSLKTVVEKVNELLKDGKKK